MSGTTLAIYLRLVVSLQNQIQPESTDIGSYSFLSFFSLPPSLPPPSPFFLSSLFTLPLSPQVFLCTLSGLTALNGTEVVDWFMLKYQLKFTIYYLFFLSFELIVTSFSGDALFIGFIPVKGLFNS